MEIDLRTIEIRKLRADIPAVKTNLYSTVISKKIEKHFILEYPDLTVSLARKNAFYLYIYPYLLLAQKKSLKEIFNAIAQDYQTFNMPVVPGLN